MLHWTKAAWLVWTAPLKQSLFLIPRRRKRASWLNTDWMSVEDGGVFVVLFLLFFKFCFSLLCRASSSEGRKKRTRATVLEPRGPQEPWGVPTLMEAWASLEQIAWWGQEHTATTVPLLQTPNSTLTDKYRQQNVFPPDYFLCDLWWIKIGKKISQTYFWTCLWQKYRKSGGN